MQTVDLGKPLSAGNAKEETPWEVKRENCAATRRSTAGRPRDVGRAVAGNSP